MSTPADAEVPVSVDQPTPDVPDPSDPSAASAAGASAAGASAAGDSASGVSAAGVTEPGATAQSTRALLVAVLAGALLAITAANDALPLLVGISVVQAVLIVGWVLGTGLPGRIGGVVIAGAAAAGSDVGMSVWPHSELSPLLAVLGLAIPVLFAHQLLRGVVRVRVVESLSDIGLVLVAVVAASSWLQLEHELDGSVLAAALTACAALSVVVALVADLVWSRPRFDAAVPRGLLGVVLAVVAAAALGGPRLADAAQFTLARGLLVSGAVGAVCAFLLVAASFVYYGTSVEPTRFGRALRPIPLALLPITLVAPIAYLLCLSMG